MPKRKKKKTQQQIQNRIARRRMNKILHLMGKQGSPVPQGHSRRLYDFWPSETGVEVPPGENPKKYVISKSEVVPDYKPSLELSHKENKAARDAYFSGLRENLLNQVRESVNMPVIKPEPHNPEGLTTLDLDNLTSAGEDNADQ
jgi:hypothetical protein